MNALSFYLSTSKYVMQADFNDSDSWSELYRYLPYLRQALSCCVCRSILKDPMGPNHKVCQHFVCKLCINEQMTIKPQCSWCKKRECFEESVQMKMVTSCFKRLCEYINNSPIGSHLKEVGRNGETDSLMKILEEGANFEDNYETLPFVAPPKRMFTQTVQDISKDLTLSTPSCSSPEASTLIEEDNTVPIKSKVINKPQIKMERVKKSQQKKISRLKKYKWYTKPRKKLTLTKKRSVRVKKAQEDNLCDNSDDFVDVTTEDVKYEIKNEFNNDGRPGLKVKLRAKKRENYTNTEYTNETDHHRRNYNNENLKVHVDKHDRCSNVEPSIKKLKLIFGDNEFKVCKCGRGGTSSQLTCLGQRCPCYVKKLPCIKCKCKGCRNPRKSFDQDNDQVLRSINSTAEQLLVSL